MIIVRVGLATGAPGLAAIGVSNSANNSDLEFAATNPRPAAVIRATRGENSVELKSMTVDLTDRTSITDRDTKVDMILGTSSSESNPRKSRSSL